MGGPPSLAVLVPHAIELMTQTDLEGLVLGMASIADNAHEHGCCSASQAAAVGLQGTTLHAWSLAVGHRGRFTSRLRSRSLPPMRNSEMSKLLPQVLWPEATDRFFADILDWVLPSHKRRFLSLALGVAATKASFADVSAQLQLPEDSWDARFYKAVTNGLRQRGEDDAAYRGLLDCHEWLSDKEWTVDYTSRRAALPSVPVISPSEWRWACWSTGSHVGAGQRHRHAQIWLWLAITGNAYSLPGVPPGPELAAQRRFVAEDLPRLERALLLLGARELWKHGLRGGVRGDLSGWEPTPEQPRSDLAAVGPIAGEPGHRPAAPSPQAASLDKPLGHDPDIDRLCVLFSVIDLAKLLGLGPETIRRARHGIRSPKGPRRRRISYLLDLVDTLAVARNDHQVREWFRDEGRGPAPLGLLAANAWEPVDPVARLLLQRAQAETSGGAKVRRRLVIVTDCAERAFRRDRPRVVPADVLEVVSHLGVDHTAGVMDVLPVVVQRYRRGESYPNRLILARFGQVRKILDALGGSPDAAKSWFTAPNAALGRRSPSECLHGSWVPEGPVAVKVLQAARVAPRPPLARYDELADATRG
jgi:hypothetical protein